MQIATLYHVTQSMVFRAVYFITQVKAVRYILTLDDAQILLHAERLSLHLVLYCVHIYVEIKYLISHS